MGSGTPGLGGNNYGGHNMTQNKTNQLATQKGKKLVHVAVVSAAESSTITLVAVCADGRRVYLTSLPSAGYGGRYNGGGIQYNGVTGNSQNSQRCLTPAVTRLAIIAVRDPPPAVLRHSWYDLRTSAACDDNCPSFRSGSRVLRRRRDAPFRRGGG